MKIALYFNLYFSCGGIEKSMYNLGKLLSEKGHKITYIFNGDKQSFSMLKMLSKNGRIINYKYLNDEYFDVCIYNSTYNNKEVNSILKGQIIHTLLDDLNETYKDSCMNFYISVSEEVQRQFKKVSGIDSIVIPNMIIKSDIMISSNDFVDIEKAEYNFVTVSRIAKDKGFERIEKIIIELENRNIDYKWYIVGDNHIYSQYLQVLKSRWRKYKNIIFVGEKDNPYPYLKNADVSFILSDRESQCLVLYESLLLGTPVVATPFYCATKEINNSNGLLIDFDMNNLNIDNILDLKGRKFTFDYVNQIDKYDDVLKLPEKKDYKFTILIPNYNNAQYLEKCINSVLSQTYKNYEIIFVDDMSTDNSLDIAKKTIGNKQSALIIPLKQKRYNGGARNVGIIVSNSDYTLCIDSDDWLADSNVLKHINDKLRGEDIMLLGYKQWNGSKYTGEALQSNTSKDYVFMAGTCAIWTKLVKTSLLKDTLFSEGTLMEDRVNHYRLVDKAKRITSLNEVTHVWNRTNKHSVSTERNSKWDTSSYRFLADMIDFTNETSNEYYKTFVIKRIVEQKKLIAQGRFTQI